MFPSLTVNENLEMGGYLRKGGLRERLDWVVSLFPRLGERIGQRAGSLSGGERQMLAMGRALMMEPKVLLLDEPSAGLSPMLQDQVFERVEQVNDAGVSIIMVEQNAARCLQICDRGYVLDQGRNAYTGTGAGADDRPQGHRAVPRHARQGALTDLRSRVTPRSPAVVVGRVVVGPSWWRVPSGRRRVMVRSGLMVRVQPPSWTWW